MGEIKSFFNSFFLAMVLSISVFSFVSAEEESIGVILDSEEVAGTIDSEEIIMKSGDEDDGGGIDAASEVKKEEVVMDSEEGSEVPTFNENQISEDIEGFNIEDLPMPTPENSVEQEAPKDEASNVIDENETISSDDRKENPFSAIALIFIGIPIAVILFFVIRKYIQAHK